MLIKRIGLKAANEQRGDFITTHRTAATESRRPRVFSNYVLGQWRDSKSRMCTRKQVKTVLKQQTIAN